MVMKKIRGSNITYLFQSEILWIIQRINIIILKIHYLLSHWCWSFYTKLNKVVQTKQFITITNKSKLGANTWIQNATSSHQAWRMEVVRTCIKNNVKLMCLNNKPTFNICSFSLANNDTEPNTSLNSFR